MVNSWRSFAQYQSIWKRELDNLSDQLDQSQAGLIQAQDQFEEEKAGLAQERTTFNQVCEQHDQLSANLNQRQSMVQHLEETIRPFTADIRSTHAHSYQAYNFANEVVQRLNEIEDNYN